MPDRTPYTAMIRAVALTYELPFPVLEAQVLAESAGKPDAFRWEPWFYAKYIKGNTNARASAYGPLAACSYGLLQIILETACERGYTGRPEQLFVPEIGLTWGAVQLRYLKDTLKDRDYDTVLAAYNGGLGIVTHGISTTTQLYIQRVRDLVQT